MIVVHVLMESLASVFGADAFRWPWALALVFVPILASIMVKSAEALGAWRTPRAQYARTHYSDPDLQAWLLRGSGFPLLHWLGTLLRGAGWMLLCIALAQPLQWQRRATPTENNPDALRHAGTHLVLAWPLCSTARTPEPAVQRSLLTAALDGLKGADLSLLIFTGSAAELLPATHDPALQRRAIAQLDPSLLSGNDCDADAAKRAAQRIAARERPAFTAHAQALILVGAAQETSAAEFAATQSLQEMQDLDAGIIDTLLDQLPAPGHSTLRAVERFDHALWPGLLLYLLGLTRGLTRGRLLRRPIRLPKQAAGALLWLPALLLCLPPAPAQGADQLPDQEIPWARAWQRGLLELQQHDTLHARADLETAWLLAPDAQRWQALYNLALAHAALGDWLAAIQAWEQVLRERPGHAPTLHNLHIARREWARLKELGRPAQDLYGRRGLGASGTVQTDRAGPPPPLTAEVTTAQGNVNGRDNTTGRPEQSAQTPWSATRDDTTLGSAQIKQSALQDDGAGLLQGLLRADQRRKDSPPHE